MICFSLSFVTLSQLAKFIFLKTKLQLLATKALALFERATKRIKSENVPSTPLHNGVKSKEAARKNILQYVGKMQAKEQKEAKELISRGGESSPQVNGTGPAVAGHVATAAPTANDKQEKERVDIEEKIAESNGNIIPGTLCEEDAEEVPVKMRAQKKTNNEVNDNSDLSTSDNQNMSSALKRLVPTEKGQEAEEDNQYGQAENFDNSENTAGSDERVQRAASAVSSGNNTLKRNWRKSSKKKRKSAHIL